MLKVKVYFDRLVKLSFISSLWRGCSDRFTSEFDINFALSLIKTKFTYVESLQMESLFFFLKLVGPSRKPRKHGSGWSAWSQGKIFFRLESHSHHVTRALIG